MGILNNPYEIGTLNNPYEMGALNNPCEMGALNNPFLSVIIICFVCVETCAHVALC